jgi:hypothetical protein
MTTQPVDNTTTLREYANATGDLLLQALQTMHRLMGSNDADVAFKAAKAVLDLEKTRMRHGESSVWLRLNHLGDNEGDGLPPKPMRPEPAEEVEHEELVRIDTREDELDNVADETKVKNDLPKNLEGRSSATVQHDLLTNVVTRRTSGRLNRFAQLNRCPDAGHPIAPLARITCSTVVKHGIYRRHYSRHKLCNKRMGRGLLHTSPIDDDNVAAAAVAAVVAVGHGGCVGEGSAEGRRGRVQAMLADHGRECQG